MIRRIYIFMCVITFASISIVSAHEERDLLLGTSFFEYLFIAIATLFVGLLCCTALERLPLKSSTKKIWYGGILIGGIGVLVYYAYHYFIH